MEGLARRLRRACSGTNAAAASCHGRPTRWRNDDLRCVREFGFHAGDGDGVRARGQRMEERHPTVRRVAAGGARREPEHVACGKSVDVDAARQVGQCDVVAVERHRGGGAPRLRKIARSCIYPQLLVVGAGSTARIARISAAFARERRDEDLGSRLDGARWDTSRAQRGDGSPEIPTWRPATPDYGILICRSIEDFRPQRDQSGLKLGIRCRISGGHTKAQHGGDEEQDGDHTRHVDLLAWGSDKRLVPDRAGLSHTLLGSSMQHAYFCADGQRPAGPTGHRPSALGEFESIPPQVVSFRKAAVF